MKFDFEIKPTKSEFFFIISVKTDKASFNLFWKYDKDFGAWGLLEPTNNSGFKIFSLSDDFKTAIKSAVLNKINSTKGD